MKNFSNIGKWGNSQLAIFSGYGLRVVILLFFSPVPDAKAQLSIPLNREMDQRVESGLMTVNPGYFSCIKPYNDKSVREYINLDSTLSFVQDQRHNSWFGRKLYDESFLRVDSQEFSLHVDPLFTFSLGSSAGNPKPVSTNMRGVRATLQIGKTIGIESAIYECQEFFPNYWDEYISAMKVVPGQGRTKRYNGTGWDFDYTEGYFRWNPGKHVDLQFGQGKNFIGDGYRSLLLSDVSTNYPFLKLMFTWKNFQYTRIIASFMNVDYTIINKDLRAFPKKTANFHLLSFNPVNDIQVSIFEGDILKNPYNNPVYRINYDLIDPVPFINNVFRKPNGSNPVTVVEGINLRWNVSRHIQVYNQWSFTNLFGNDQTGSSFSKKYGVQAGIKYFNALGIDQLYMQAEVNRVMPFTYASADTTVAYAHYSQPLADPLGANFEEGIGIINYRYHRWFAEYMGCFAKYGDDNGSLVSGHDLFESDPGKPATFLQGTKTNLSIHQVKISWYLNPATNMCLSAGFYYRGEGSSLINNLTRVVYVSFSTNLRNIYYDF